MGGLLRFVGGLAVGFATGAALVLLYTPQSGADVQQGIRDRVQQAVDEGRAAQEAKREELERQAGIRR